MKNLQPASLPSLRVLSLVALAWVALACDSRSAQEAPPLPVPKPVPRLQVVPQPYHQVSFQRGGVEIGRYHYAPTLNRPFVFP